MSSDFNAFLIVAAGTAANATAKVQQSQSPVKVLIAGCVFGAICVGLNNATNTKIGTLIAVVFLLSSMMTNGTRVITTVTNVINSSTSTHGNVPNVVKG